MAHYLITGGCGFIGSHLADSLIEDNHSVTILDDLSTGKRENAPSKAQVVIGDARDYNIVEQLFHGIDGCFHLAAIASVEKSITHWKETHTVNATATVNIFQAASRQKNKVPVVYASSAAVYGNNPNIPLSEREMPAPLTAYGVDKLSCDLNARIAWEVHHIPTIGLRPFNIYGPRQDPKSPYSGVISIFADKISNNQTVTIYGSGKQVRDFVYVADAVKVFRASMANLQEGHNIINICTGNATSINRIADVLERLCNCKVERKYAPPRKGDIAVSIGDPGKLLSLLNLRLTTLLEEGLSYTIERRREVA
jgi:UDP-glucose 4-epimerase